MSGRNYTEVTVDQVEDVLNPLGFVPVSIPNCRERVYELRYAHRHFIRVYSSIEGRYSRSSGKDAVKVTAVAKWQDRDHFVCHTKRINRVGGIDAIQQRLRERIHEMQILNPRVEIDSRGQPMTLRKNKQNGSLFWGQPDWNRIPKDQRETKPFQQ